ncbi:hypothetical protein BaOVIS_001130 [Babesia ovis]|uniref:Uncharacterized protein n=1 Tax=Babesia ovis TaxID=5869 RepID=A0A9W5WTF1_BABOV|nr:hypothetical protein BaOVIS_001130 [Babesia ovis]
MKLPFLLNSATRSSSASDVEGILLKLAKVIPQLEGPQVSNILNILSKKDVDHNQGSWNRVSNALLSRQGNQSINVDGCRGCKNDGHLNNPITLAGNNIDRSISTDIGFKDIPNIAKGDPRSPDDIANISSVLYTYDIKDVIIILNAFSKVGFMPKEFMNVVVQIVTRHMNIIGGHELSSLVHSLGKHGMIDDVKKILEGYLNLDEGYINEQDYSMIVSTLVLNQDKLGKNPEFNKLLETIDNKCGSMSDQSIAILVNSLGKFGRDEKGLLPMLVPIIIKRLNNASFDPLSISQIANGIARLGFLNTELMKAIALRTSSDLSKFTTRCKVTILNAFHKLNCFDSTLFKNLISDLTTHNADMTPQCIANTVAAVSHFSGKIAHGDILQLFNALHQRICMMESLRLFTMQNQVNILNGFSKIGIHDMELYQRIGDNVLVTKDQLKPIDVAIILNAFSRAKHSHAVVIYLCQNLKGYLSGMKTQELSCCVASINTLRKCTSETNTGDTSIWMTAMETLRFHLSQSPDIISSFRPLDIRLVIVSLADCNIVDHAIYSALLQCLELEIRRSSMWDLLCVFSSLAKVRYSVDTSLLDAIESSFSKIGKCKHRGMADAKALRSVIEQMGINHPLIDKLSQCHKHII